MKSGDIIKLTLARGGWSGGQEHLLVLHDHLGSCTSHKLQHDCRLATLRYQIPITLYVHVIDVHGEDGWYEFEVLIDGQRGWLVWDTVNMWSTSEVIT